MPIKHPIIIFFTIFCYFVPVIYAQSSPIVSTDETIAFLLKQTQNDKDLIERQKARIGDLENELIVERENSDSLGKSYDAAKTEISNLKSSNEALSRAVALNENTIAILQVGNIKQRDKAKKAVRDKWKAIAALAGVIALKFIVP